MHDKYYSIDSLGSTFSDLNQFKQIFHYLIQHFFKAPPVRSALPVKQTPSRPGGRFFKSSSVEKKAKKFQTPKATEGTNWLDSDDVFGFDSM